MELQSHQHKIQLNRSVPLWQMNSTLATVINTKGHQHKHIVININT